MATLNPLNHPICLMKPKRLTQFSSWHEHIPFAMFLVDLLRPNVILELGTFYGDSYCAFCQAVKELNLNTRCYAIDTWQGDPHTGIYGQEVFEDLRTHHDPLYGNFSRLIQNSFDGALQHFKDGSIDLLHIDGYHTYEIVKHDFEAWLSKMSKNGVVLFHDINVLERDFGVWRLWDELKKQYPHFDFMHGFGLGVLGVGNDYPKVFQELLEAPEEVVVKVRNFFFELGQRFTFQMQQTLLTSEKERQARDIAQLQTAVEVQKQSLEEKNRQVVQLIADRDRLTKEITQLQIVMEEKDRQVTQEITQHKANLNVIYDSHGWKALVLYYKIRGKILPPDTKRSALAKFVFNMVWRRKRFLKNCFNRREIHEFTISKRNTLQPIMDKQFNNDIIYKDEKPPIQDIYYQCDNPLHDGMEFYGDFSIAGWAIALDGIDKVEVYSDDIFLGNAHYGLPRPDVQSHYPFITESERAGFRFTITNLDAGSHTLTMKIITKQGKTETMTRKVTTKQLNDISALASTGEKIKMYKTNTFIKNKILQENVIMKADSVKINHKLQELKLELLNSIKSVSS